MCDTFEIEYNNLAQLCTPGLTTRRDIKLINIMSVSDHPTKKWNHTSWWGRVLLKYPILRSFCCLDDGNLQDVMFDIDIRDHTREAMKQHTDAIGNTGVETEMMVIYKETGYDLGRCAEKMNEELAKKAAASTNEKTDVDGCDANDVVKKTINTTMTPTVNDTNSDSCSSEADWGRRSKVLRHRGRVQLVPAFIAATTMALRSKFGHMSVSDANRMLIEREYLKICREAHVRHTDMNHHRQFVLNTFFNETLMEEVALSRPRMPAWVRRLFAREQTSAPTVC